MGCQAEVYLGDNLVFSVVTHDPELGGDRADADSLPTYRVYEDETPTPILTGTMAKLDDANTTGFYTELLACTTGNGFESGRTYTIYIEATVNSHPGGISYAFRAVDPLTQQEVRDALKLAPTAGDPAAGSVDKHLDDILEDTGTTLPATLAAIQAKTDLLDTAAVTAVSGIDGDEITIYHGATFDVTVTGLTIPSDWVKVLFTLKSDDADTDASALAQVQESNPGAGTDGLIRINAAAPGAGENTRAELVVNQAGGSVRVRLHQLCTVVLMPRSARWDLKVITADTIPEGTPLVVSSPATVVYTTTRSTA